MSLGTIAVRNAWRNRSRAVLTVLAVAVSLIAFLLLRTVLSAWTVGLESAAKDRIGSRHKVTFMMTLPKRYVTDIAEVPGVSAVTWLNWFGAKYPKNEREVFGTMAVDPRSFLSVYDEIVVPDAEKDAWFADRRGVLVGDVLAKKLGWKVGDPLTLSGTIFPGDWEFVVRGIYTATRKSVDRSSVWMHWDYLNESMPGPMRDQVGWIAARIDDPSQAAKISQIVDAKFAERDVPTITMSEKAMVLSFMGMVSAVLTAIDVVALVILLIMTLILGNTIAMGVRERTHEYGVLRAIGFLPKHLVAFVLGEAVTVGALGGALGLALGYPFINLAVGRFLEENLGAIFPYFDISRKDAVLAFVLAVVLAGVAAILPAVQASKLKVTDALRRIG